MMIHFNEALSVSDFTWWFYAVCLFDIIEVSSFLVSSVFFQNKSIFEKLLGLELVTLYFRNCKYEWIVFFNLIFCSVSGACVSLFSQSAQINGPFYTEWSISGVSF